MSMQQPTKKRIPFCPLLSAGLDNYKVCIQEDCAWYFPTTKTCTAFVLAHNNLLEIKQKQEG